MTIGFAEHSQWMDAALAQAALTEQSGDVPVGAIIVDKDGTVIASAHNTKERDNDPLGHAEVNAIKAATHKQGSWRLEECTLVVTLEPCVMCAGAILAARIPTVVFGAWDEKAGAAGSVHDLLRDRRNNHRVEVYTGVREKECGALLTEFFRSRFG